MWHQTTIIRKEASSSVDHNMISSSKNQRLLGGRNKEEQPTHFIKSREQSMNQRRNRETERTARTRNKACNMAKKIVLQLVVSVVMTFTVSVKIAMNVDTKVMWHQTTIIRKEASSSVDHNMISSSKNQRLYSSTLCTA
jgi:hypothetical protein